MKGFFNKIFGSKKDTVSGKKGNSEDMITQVLDILEEVLKQVLEAGDFDLSYELGCENDSDFYIELFGSDDDLLKEKDGQLLDAFQLYLKRVVQHNFPENYFEVFVDSDGFREEANKSLIELAERLKKVAKSKGKPVYIRALPPRDRKVIHQYFSDDSMVKSKSIGDGMYKKIKIFLVSPSESSDKSL